MSEPLWIPVVPEPWRRTRGAGAARFNDADSRAYRDEIRWRLRSHFTEPFDGWFSVTLDFAPSGVSFCVAPGQSRPDGLRGDIDNLAKAILDAGNGIVWHDDRQITALRLTLTKEDL